MACKVGLGLADTTIGSVAQTRYTKLRYQVTYYSNTINSEL